MKLLIVEDEKILAKVLQEKLEKEGFTIAVAGDGEAALSQIRSFRPDMVLLDIILPKKDGLQVLEEIKADSEFSHLPVIMLSNLGEDEKIKSALKLGAVDYLVKAQHPINEVVEKIKEHLFKTE